MKNVINFIVMIFLIGWIIIVASTPDINANEQELKPYLGYIVTDKINNFFLSNYMTIRKDTLVYIFISEDIIFEKYAIGDTLK